MPDLADSEKGPAGFDITERYLRFISTAILRCSGVVFLLETDALNGLRALLVEFRILFILVHIVNPRDPYFKLVLSPRIGDNLPIVDAFVQSDCPEEVSVDVFVFFYVDGPSIVADLKALA